jgi:hypothetical protein
MPPSPTVHTVAAGAQSGTQPPFEQTLAESHVLPHAPQFAGSLSVLTQAPLHETCGAEQLALVCPHATIALPMAPALVNMTQSQRVSRIVQPTVRRSPSSS